MLFNFPVNIVLTMIFLWDLLGASSMVGLVVMLLIVPLNVIVAKIRKRLEVSLEENKNKNSNDKTQTLL